MKPINDEAMKATLRVTKALADPQRVDERSRRVAASRWAMPNGVAPNHNT